MPRVQLQSGFYKWRSGIFCTQIHQILNLLRYPLTLQGTLQTETGLQLLQSQAAPSFPNICQPLQGELIAWSTLISLGLPASLASPGKLPVIRVLSHQLQCNISIPGPYHWDKTLNWGKLWLTNSWVRPYFRSLWATRPGSLPKRLDGHSGTHHDYIGQVSWDKSIHASRGAHHRCSHISYWHCQGPWEKEQGFVTIASQINTLSPNLLPCYCLFCANCCRSVINWQREGGAGNQLTCEANSVL